MESPYSVVPGARALTLLYTVDLQTLYRTGKATEHSHRDALHFFIESIDQKVQAVNEPNRVRCGASDYTVQFLVVDEDRTKCWHSVLTEAVRNDLDRFKAKEPCPW